MRFAAQAPPRILIVADDLTLQFCSTPRVRELMRRALRVLRRDGNLVAMASTGYSEVAVPLSADLIGLDSAIRKVAGGGLSSREVAGTKLRPEIDRELRHRAAVSFSTAATALRSIHAREPGAVIVLYFTDGYPASIPEPTELIEEARRTNATIYPVDPRAFDRPGPECVPDLDAYVAATRGSHWTLASQTNGSVVFTADDLDAVLLGPRKMVR